MGKRGKAILNDIAIYLMAIIIGVAILVRFQVGIFTTPIPEIIHSIWEILI